MKKQWVMIGIILLFVGVTIVPTIAQNTEKSQTISRGNWLYVGGSGPGNYTRIQDAINASSAGDTVFVYDDSSPYNESIVINTPLTLFGENQTTTQINGITGVRTITVNANWITIKSFTIVGAIGLMFVSNVTFENNTLDSCDLGGTGQYCRFFNNTIGHSQWSIGIQGNHSVWKYNKFNDPSGFYSNGQYDDVEYNIFINCGVMFEASFGLFAHNIVQNIYSGVRVGLVAGTVRDNTIRNCSTGIYVNNGLLTTFSHNNFLNNKIDATFQNSRLLRWKGNYWGRPLFRPKIIPGFSSYWYIAIPWIFIDWRPAQEPYDIPEIRDA